MYSSVVLDWMNGTRRCRENESSGEVDCFWTHKHGLAFERDYPTFFVNQYCVKRINRVGLARIKVRLPVCLHQIRKQKKSNWHQISTLVKWIRYGLLS